jgi:hypothetical protein
MSGHGGDISRRRFFAGAARAGTAAGAVVWITPKLSSVAFAAGSPGSPPPGGNEPVEEGNIPEQAGPPTGVGGALPFTGLDPRPALIAGTAGIVGGTMLVYASRLLPDDDAISAPRPQPTPAPGPAITAE